jgi:hypothetical protein
MLELELSESQLLELLLELGPTCEHKECRPTARPYKIYSKVAPVGVGRPVVKCMGK